MSNKLQLWQRRVALKLDALGFEVADIGKLTGAASGRLRAFLSGVNPDADLLYVLTVAKLLVSTPCPHCSATVLTLKTVAHARCDTCYAAFAMVTVAPRVEPASPRPVSPRPVAAAIAQRKARAAAALSRNKSRGGLGGLELLPELPTDAIVTEDAP